MAGIPIADNFNIQMQKPIDGRMAYSTLSSMKSQADTSIYDGCLAYCSEDDKYYKFLSTNTVDPDTGKWRELQTGGGGTTYTAGDGIDITSDVISTQQSQAGDIDEIIDVYPQVGSLVSIASAFNKSDIYSTSERMIGQWIDGKPLYQKSLYVPFSSFTTSGKFKTYNLSNNLPSGITIRNVFGYAKSATYGICTIGASNFGGNADFSDEWAVGYYYSSVSMYSKVSVSRMDNDIKPDLYATVQYTKDTDSAVSIGNDTDYSTTEKIIGTWIDGKPIYQKTLSKTINSTAGSWTDFETMANVNMLGFVGYATDGSQNYPVPYSSGTAYLTFRHESGKIQYITGDSNWMNNNTVYLTIIYTKSTA